MDSTLYGNTYALNDMMADLTNAVMTGDDPKKPVSAMRCNIQTEYVFKLLNMINGGTMLPAIQDVALYELHRIEKAVQKDWPAYALTPAHRDHLLYRIRRGLDEK